MNIRLTPALEVLWLNTGTSVSRPWRWAGWPNSFCRPTQEPALATANTEDTREGFWQNEGDWTGEVEISFPRSNLSLVCFCLLILFRWRLKVIISKSWSLPKSAPGKLRVLAMFTPDRKRFLTRMLSVWLWCCPCFPQTPVDYISAENKPSIL